MQKFLLFIAFLISVNQLTAQTFNGTGGAIPDNNVQTCFPINVTGVGTLNGTYGLATICIDITHTFDADLNIYIKSPDGTLVQLSTGNGGTGDNYTGTCFSMSATVNITGGNPPFSNTYIPEGNLGQYNNGQSGTGVWSLCITDIFATETGTLNSWSITFNNTPAPPVPVIPGCGGNAPAGNDCSTATPVCNFDGYCGNTSATYDVNVWPQLETAFCGSIENNSFITFVASATTASFNVFVSLGQDGASGGIQMFFYDGGCGSGAVNTYGCYLHLFPTGGAVLVQATGLTPGSTYYLMFDGYAGDVCDYSIVPLNGVNILTITPPAVSICVGQSVTLTTNGGNGIYNWAGPNLNTTTGATVIATPTVTSVYTVTSVDPTGSCPVTKNITITITNIAPPPTVTAPGNYCQGSSAVPLSATGTSLSWFTTATGGTGSATAPTPSTATVGSTTYYVSQTLICGESVRVPITVTVNAVPAAPAVTSPLTYCQGSVASALTATGTGLLWYTAATGGTGSSTAPIPSTVAVGSTIYYVSQTVTTCEGPRAAITVSIITSPASPVVSSPVTLCQGTASAALTATGTSLLWYTVATGGTGSVTAPTPSTASVGTATWYVSQAIGSCRGPRAPIVVNIVLSTPAPVTTNLVYCQGQVAPALTATGTSLLWYAAAAGGVGSAIAPVPGTAIIGATSYYVTQTLTCGESVRQPLIVTITNTPAAPVVTSPVAYCQNVAAAALTATGTNLVWYTVAAGGTGSATAPVPSTVSTGSTTWYVSQANGSCEGPRAAITVTVNSIPVAPIIISPVTYCQNETAIALTATGTGLLWYNVATGGTGTAIAPVPSTATSGSTNYYVSQTSSNCESPRSAIIVTVLPFTPAPTASSPVIFCQGSVAAALTASGTDLLWYIAATGGSGSATAPVPSTTTAGSTTFYVTQAGTCGESVRLPVVVNIIALPTAPITTPVSICQGSTAAALTATGTNLLWYLSATGGTVSPTLIPSTGTIGNFTYYVSQTVAACEGPRAPITVTIVSLPPAPAGSGPFTYCQGTTASQLTATGSSLLWYSAATGGTGTATAPVPSTSVSGLFTYYVSQSFSCGESPRTPITVTINPTPLAPFVSSPLNYCQGTSTTALNATGINLLWYNTASGGTGSVAAPIPISTMVANTNYFVSSTIGTCQGPRALLNVIINPTPVAPAVGGPLTYCQDVIAPPLSAAGTNLLWYSSAVGGTGSPVAPSNYTETVGNTVYYVSQSIGLCEGPRSSINVTINPYPNLGDNLRDTVCAGDSVNLSAKFNTTDFSFKWTLNGIEVLNPSAVTVSGAYQLEATNSVGCSDTVMAFVTVMPVVKAFAGNDTLAIKNTPHQMSATGGVQYLWTPSYPLNRNNIANPLATLQHDQLFVVRVTDAAGCADTDTIFVKAYEGPAYYVPNAFSPNGDGLNDVFRAIPVGISYTEYFRVFNRFGQMIFETNKFLKGWDGTFLGKKQPVGTYIWMVKGMNRYGKIVEMKGSVTIVQ